MSFGIEMPTQKAEEMTHSRMQAAPENFCSLLKPNETDVERAKCACTIKEIETNLALDGPERLKAHKQIGDALLRAKKLEPRTFVKWCTENFARGSEWRCTHMALARRWNELEQARAWAQHENSILATLYSVDGTLELLRAWDLAMGRVRPRQKRSLPKGDGNAAETSSLKWTPNLGPVVKV